MTQEQAVPQAEDAVAAFLDGIPDDGLPNHHGVHHRVVTVCGHCGVVWSDLFRREQAAPLSGVIPMADTPGTKAGRRHLAEMQIADDRAMRTATILAIEAEAVVAFRAALRERVADVRGSSAQPAYMLGAEDMRAAVLALLDTPDVG